MAWISSVVIIAVVTSAALLAYVAAVILVVWGTAHLPQRARSPLHSAQGDRDHSPHPLQGPDPGGDMNGAVGVAGTETECHRLLGLLGQSGHRG